MTVSVLDPDTTTLVLTVHRSQGTWQVSEDWHEPMPGKRLEVLEIALNGLAWLLHGERDRVRACAATTAVQMPPESEPC